ncbi:hypothetical protein EVAR_14339_1 [Eumeta japonica]|uniref:Uncharacterized protein n=1 Tax=Eumeta variegata TaxID=151549 RepID=A0A4C1TX49_EUMVA|nr:hypothetical protein EVAR_14339_1 [Eumeta japonica]
MSLGTVRLCCSVFVSELVSDGVVCVRLQLALLQTIVAVERRRGTAEPAVARRAHSLRMRNELTFRHRQAELTSLALRPRFHPYGYKINSTILYVEL